MLLRVGRMPLESNLHARIRDGQNMCAHLFQLPDIPKMLDIVCKCIYIYILSVLFIIYMFTYSHIYIIMVIFLYLLYFLTCCFAIILEALNKFR